MSYISVKLMVVSIMFENISRHCVNVWIPNVRYKTDGTEECHASQKEIDTWTQGGSTNTKPMYSVVQKAKTKLYPSSS